jgi:pimeloyl-ACP methyl ester carboxylesterase
MMSSQVASDPDEPSVGASDGARTAALDDGRAIAYACYGDASGDPVVFLHGTPGSRRLAGLFERAAAERGLRILAPDRPGYGESPPWPDHGLRDAPAVVTAVMDDADVSTAGLVAFSGGAPHALAVAGNEPDRITRVDIVSGATPPAVSEEPPFLQRALQGLAARTPRLLGALFRGQAWAARRGSPEIVAAQYTEAEPDEAFSDETVDIVAEDFVEAVTGPGAATSREFARNATAWEIDLGAITSDVQLWHGARDTNVPLDDVEALAETIPDASLTVLEDADHLTTLLRATPDLLDAHA